MAMVTVYVGDYIKNETGFFKRVESIQLCCDEYIIVFSDGSIMLLDDVTMDNLFLESEVV
jgi:hypothetical protein